MPNPPSETIERPSSSTSLNRILVIDDEPGDVAALLMAFGDKRVPHDYAGL